MCIRALVLSCSWCVVTCCTTRKIKADINILYNQSLVVLYLRNLNVLSFKAEHIAFLS